jgi:hypothetical protein
MGGMGKSDFTGIELSRGVGKQNEPAILSGTEDTSTLKALVRLAFLTRSIVSLPKLVPDDSCNEAPVALLKSVFNNQP